MSIIQCGTTSTTALVQTGDTNGNLVIQTGSTPTTAMTVSSSQIVNFNNAPTVGGSPLPSGAMSLISTLTTISGTTSLSWSGLDNTKNYLILFSNLCPVTGGSNLYLRTGNFGGTFYTSGYYQNAYANEYGSTYPATIGNGVGIYLDGELGVSTYSSGSGVGISGSVFISNGPVGNYSNITYTSSFLVGNYSTPSNSNGGGFCISGGQQSFQLIFSSGNMSVNGIASLYQINK